MKKFDLDKDLLFTDSYIEEHIRIASSSISRKTAASIITDSSPLIKTFIHWNDPPFSGGFFQTVYDRDFTRPESIPLVDVSFGVSVSSSLAGVDAALSGNCQFSDQKIRNYRLYSQILLGNADKLFQIDNEEQHELIFINFRRNQFKDSILPGTFRLETVYSGNIQSLYETRVFADKLSDSRVFDSFAGLRGDVTPFGVGSFSTDSTLTGSELQRIVGHVYYQAGIIVLIPKGISHLDQINTVGTNSYEAGNWWWVSGGLTGNYDAIVQSSASTDYTMENLYTGVRQRILQIDIRNRSRVKSTFYNCVAEKNEFNYSSNPSFRDSTGLILPTSGAFGLDTRTFITKVVLLGSNNEVMAVGSLSRPVRKGPEKRISIKTRLDY